jgi:hypothetical protein
LIARVVEKVLWEISFCVLWTNSCGGLSEKCSNLKKVEDWRKTKNYTLLWKRRMEHVLDLCRTSWIPVEFVFLTFSPYITTTSQTNFSLSHHICVQYFSFEPHTHYWKYINMNSKLNDTINRLNHNDPTLTELDLTIHDQKCWENWSNPIQMRKCITSMIWKWMWTCSFNWWVWVSVCSLFCFDTHNSIQFTNKHTHFSFFLSHFVCMCLCSLCFVSHSHSHSLNHIWQMKYLYCDDAYHVKQIVSKIAKNEQDQFVKMCEKYAREHVERIKQFLSNGWSSITSTMKNDLRKMMNNSMFSDVSFKLNNNQIIHLHKVISLFLFLNTHTNIMLILFFVCVSLTLTLTYLFLCVYILI